MFRMETNNLTIVASFTPGLVIGLLGGYMLRQYWYLIFKAKHDYSHKKEDSAQSPDDSEWEDIESEDDSKSVIYKEPTKKNFFLNINSNGRIKT